MIYKIIFILGLLAMIGGITFTITNGVLSIDIPIDQLPLNDVLLGK